MLNLNQAQTFNCLAWILKNKLKNENGSFMEFEDHPFLIDPYMDCSPRQAIIKCSQIGWSVLAIIRSFHLAYYAKANIIHTFPSRNMSKDFVIPKVNPIIEKNPIIQRMIGNDSVFLKQIGDRYIYYRGTYEQTEAISISANILINDEYDRSNPKVLRTYRSRLDDSARERPELGWEWKFSNPSVPGFGVDADWQKSDQKHWFVKCRKCGHESYLRWPDSIDFKMKLKVCHKCHTLLSNDDLRAGRWVKKYNNRRISGYWLSQLFVPWIGADKIIEDSKGDKTIFYNFTLGLPYVSKDTVVSRQSITNCISPGYNPRTDVAIGVDNGVIKHYVVGNRQGIFAYGKTDSWKEIEGLRNRYAATMVIDAMPYPNTPTKLAEKYLGKVFVHYYQRDSTSAELVRWNRESRTVKSDRTKIIDYVVGEINAKDMTFNLTITELEEYFAHWKSMYRIIQDTPTGVKRPMWQSIDGQPDHYAHCLSGDTLITTVNGNVPIKDVKVGDLVLTSKGFFPVVDCGVTHELATVAEVIFSNGSKIIATPSHKFKTQRGWVELYNICRDDILVGICKLRLFQRLHKNLMDMFIGSIKGNDTFSRRPHIPKDFGYIRRFGCFLKGIFQKVTTFIISIMIQAITILKISNSFLQVIMRSLVRYLKRRNNLSVLFAGVNTLPNQQETINTVRSGVGVGYITKSITKLKENVLFVARSFKPIRILEGLLAVRSVRVVKYRVLKKQRTVYDLSVDTNHEYFANGILVSNSTVYWRIALEQTLNMGGISTSKNVSAKLVDKNPVVSEDQTVGALDLEAVAERAGRRTRRR